VAATPDRCAATRCWPAWCRATPVAVSVPRWRSRGPRAHCLERLAYYKAPGYVAFVDALPLTPTQKVQRGELKALAHALPGRPTASTRAR
jgi:acyl-CoA synthetase (AMP-forming)/AMP-acid ligase II